MPTRLGRRGVVFAPELLTSDEEFMGDGEARGRAPVSETEDHWSADHKCAQEKGEGNLELIVKSGKSGIEVVWGVIK